MDDGSEHKKDKRTKKPVIKREFMFENYKDSLFNEKFIFKKQQRFKIYYYDMHTKEINQVGFRSNDKKRLQTSHSVTTFPPKISDFKVCENKAINVGKVKQTLKILNKKGENELYITCNIFLNYMKTKCAGQM